MYSQARHAGEMMGSCHAGGHELFADLNELLFHVVVTWLARARSP